MFMELRKRDLRPQKLCRSKLIIIIYHKSRSRQKIPIPGVPVYTKSVIFLPMKLKKKAQLLGRFELWAVGLVGGLVERLPPPTEVRISNPISNMMEHFSNNCDIEKRIKRKVAGNSKIRTHDFGPPSLSLSDGV